MHPTNPHSDTPGTRSRLHREHGLEAVEVALMGAIIAAVLVAAIPVLGDAIVGVFTNVVTVVNDALPVN